LGSTFAVSVKNRNSHVLFTAQFNATGGQSVHLPHGGQEDSQFGLADLEKEDWKHSNNFFGIVKAEQMFKACYLK
jgi:hypothetical protein